MNLCGQKNSQPSVDLNFDEIPINIGDVDGVSITYNTNSFAENSWKTYTSDQKVYGDANPVMPGEVTHGGCLNLSGQQTKLLKTVVDYLNQASTALYFSDNRFLSTAAKDLANQLSDQFCIG